MIDRQLRNLWDALQGQRPHMSHFLTEISLAGIRGIDNLRVQLNYPVSVLAGGNGVGKSTVLFAAACAYDVPDSGREFIPATLFSDYRPKQGARGDKRGETTLQFEYSTPEGRLTMIWRRKKGWNRSFLGRRNADQPKREVYLRTLSNLTNPSERRGVLGMSRMKSMSQESPLTASQIAFAQRLLPFNYAEVIDLSGDNKANLLFATQENGAVYSELHMAAGERAILRLSKEIAQAEGSLVLIDEVEAGLHPFAQKGLMLELQQLALRNDLQIIVTTHSPVVLDTVPEIGRIFLGRNEVGGVSVRPPYRDLIQDVLYGRLEEKFNLFCGGDVAESLMQGVFDIITPRLRARRESIRIGGGAGLDEFPRHAKMFQRFGQFQNFIFVLDGDRRGTGLEQSLLKNTQHEGQVVFLPGKDAPEVWVWSRMRKSLSDLASALGINQDAIFRNMETLDSIYDSAASSRSEIAKTKLRSLSDIFGWPHTDVCRMVARVEAASKESDIQPLVEDLEMAFGEWRRNI